MFHLNVRKNFTVRIAEHWNRLPTDLVESPSVEIVKSCLDTILSNMLWGTMLEQRGWTKQPPVVPSNITHSAILWIYDFCTTEWSKSNIKLRGKSQEVFSLRGDPPSNHATAFIGMREERRKKEPRAKLCFLETAPVNADLWPWPRHPVFLARRQLL